MRKAFAVWAALLVLGTFVPAQAAPPQDGGTAAASDNPVVAGPIPEKITATSVVVWWQTTVPEESILTYGAAPDDLPYRVQRPWRTTTHEISLKKLQAATTYYLAILQPDGSRSATSQFTTQPLGYAGQSGVRITNGPLFERITPDSATIAWSSNRPSSFLVRYGTDPQHLTATAKVPWTPTTHRVVINNLQPDTRYYFTIASNQSSAGSNQPAPESGQASPEESGEASASTQSSPAQEEETVPHPTPTSPVYAFHTLARGQQVLEIGPQR